MLGLTLSPPPPDIAQRTRWYVRIRWAVLSIIAVPGILSLYISEGFSQQIKRDTILGLLAIGSNGIFYLLARRQKRLSYYKGLSIVLLGVDILVISTLIFIKGGIESRSVILYTIPILMSAAIFGRRPVYITSLTCAVFYSWIIAGDYLQLFHTLGAYNPELRLQLPYVINTLVFMNLSLLVVGAMVNFINKLLVTQEAQVLESLNATKIAQSIAKLGSWEWDNRRDVFRWPAELNKIFSINVPEEGANHNDILARVHPDDQHLVRNSLRSSLKSKRIFTVEHRIISNGGRVRYAITEGKPITSRAGKVTRVVGTTRDITDAKILEDAKTDFVSLASHQLRTPATSVKQYLGMLLDNYAGKPTAKQASLLRIAYESNERQLSIVDDLLQVALIDADKLTLKYSRCNVQSLMQTILKTYTPIVERKSQKLELVLQGDTEPFRLDKQRVRMVIENLLDNASKYSADGTTITLRCNQTKSALIFRVTDQGVGIAKSDIGQLFQKFSRIDNPVSTVVGGTGLGLYLAAQIVQLHQGAISVESKLGHGTTFTVTIPKNQNRQSA